MELATRLFLRLIDTIALHPRRLKLLFWFTVLFPFYDKQIKLIFSMLGW